MFCFPSADSSVIESTAPADMCKWGALCVRWYLLILRYQMSQSCSPAAGRVAREKWTITNTDAWIFVLRVWWKDSPTTLERKHECVLHCWSVPMHVMHVFDVRELPLGFLFLSLFSPLSTLGRPTVRLAQCFAHCIKDGSRLSSKVPCDKAGRDGMFASYWKRSEAAQPHVLGFTVAADNDTLVLRLR